MKKIEISDNYFKYFYIGKLEFGLNSSNELFTRPKMKEGWKELSKYNVSNKIHNIIFYLDKIV